MAIGAITGPTHGVGSKKKISGSVKLFGQPIVNLKNCFYHFSSTISPSTIRLFSKSDDFIFPLGGSLPIFLKR